MDRNLQILGLAKKAGLLAVGARDTLNATRAGKARLVISAGDSSVSSLSRARKSSEACHVLHLEVPYSGFELGNVSGRGSPCTVAILDAGLAARFVRGMADMDPARYGESAEMLTRKAARRAENKKQTLSGKRRTMQ
jgi:ribosomal protein L30E